MAHELTGGGSSRKFQWSSSSYINGGGGGGRGDEFSSREEFRNTFLDQENGGFVLAIHCSEAADKRIKETTKLNNHQVQIATKLLSLPPLGLKLTITAPFLNFVEKHVKPTPDKLKACNFSASLLVIGTWKRESRNDGDLVAKCYFAKRKLVWEFLEQGLKRKIEIQWNDIIGIKAVLEENQPGILELELNQPPSLQLEKDPEPRKHTTWKQASDFTDGQATRCRRHYLKFPPGILDKNYEKLIHYDQRLYELSQKPFPTSQSPYFEPNMYSFSNFKLDFNGDDHLRSDRMFSFSGLLPLVATQQQYAHFQDSNSPISDELRLWSGVHQNATAATTNNIQFSSQLMNNPTGFSYQNYPNPSNLGETQTQFLNAMLNNIESLGDRNHHQQQIVGSGENGYDDKYELTRISSLTALAELPEQFQIQQQHQEQVPGENCYPQQTFYDYEMSINNEQVHHQAQAFQEDQQQVSWNYLPYTTNNNVVKDPNLQNFGPFK